MVERSLPGVMCTAAETVVTGILAVGSQVTHSTHGGHKFQVGQTASARHFQVTCSLTSCFHFIDRDGWCTDQSLAGGPTPVVRSFLLTPWVHFPHAFLLPRVRLIYPKLASVTNTL